MVRRGWVVWVAAWGLAVAGCAVVAPPPAAPDASVGATATSSRPAPVPAPLPPAPQAPPPPSAAAPSPGDVVTLWYGTNRAPSQPFEPAKPYTVERGSRLSFGTADVWVPSNRRRGSLGSLWGGWMGSDAPVRFLAAQALEEDRFWQRLVADLRSQSQDGKVVLVFIHGYNNSFEDAAVRTAQLWKDLDLRGIPAFFSWPSRASTALYPVDEASIEVSEFYLEQFLLRLRAQVGDAQPIHLIAHSMGNRALLRVAQRLQDRLRFGQIILAAPDVDLDLFLQLAAAYPRISERTTLYVSRTDKPVRFSDTIHRGDRVGSPPGFAQAEQIDTVEVVSETGMLELGHSYFAELDPVLDELAALLKTNPRRDLPFAGRRADLRTECGYAGGFVKTEISCWRIVAQPK